MNSYESPVTETVDFHNIPYYKLLSTRGLPASYISLELTPQKSHEILLVQSLRIKETPYQCTHFGGSVSMSRISLVAVMVNPSMT